LGDIPPSSSNLEIATKQAVVTFNLNKESLIVTS